MAAEIDGLTVLAGRYNCPVTLPVTAAPLARHGGLARYLQAQGVELAIHGFNHVDHTLLSLDKLVSSVQQAAQVFHTAGVRAAGFRAPYLRWNAPLLLALRSCGFAYDSSQALALEVCEGLETPRYARALEFYGALSAAEHPALPRLEAGLVRIPYCLPDDEALVERLRLPSGSAMTAVWLQMLEAAYARGELLTLGLHPERFSLCRQALEAVLQRAGGLTPGVWMARLDEIARWQCGLAAAKFEAEHSGEMGWRITVRAPAEAELLARGLEVFGPAQPWGADTLLVRAREIFVRSPKRPWIGLAPDCPDSLGDFLHQQGYLVETGADSQAFCLYLHLQGFNQADERRLLNEIDTGGAPLVRLGRWPGGAKCALAVSGDVDAFTLWDYTHRLNGG